MRSIVEIVCCDVGGIFFLFPGLEIFETAISEQKILKSVGDFQTKRRINEDCPQAEFRKEGEQRNEVSSNSYVNVVVVKLS